MKLPTVAAIVSLIRQMLADTASNMQLAVYISGEICQIYSCIPKVSECNFVYSSYLVNSNRLY